MECWNNGMMKKDVKKNSNETLITKASSDRIDRTNRKYLPLFRMKSGRVSSALR
jgi:hypothetical protein